MSAADRVGGRGWAGRLPPRLTQSISDLPSGDFGPAVQPVRSFGSCPRRSGPALPLCCQSCWSGTGIGRAFPAGRLCCGLRGALTAVRWAGPALRRAQVLFLQWQKSRSGRWPAKPLRDSALSGRIFLCYTVGSFRRGLGCSASEFPLGQPPCAHALFLTPHL